VLDSPWRRVWIEDRPPAPVPLVEFNLGPGPVGETLLTLSETF
jgi:hypothetical protein